jgi:hypothetical protein
MLRPFYQKMDREHSCSHIYQKGAELAVEAALSAPSLFPGCRLPAALQRLAKKKS